MIGFQTFRDLLYVSELKVNRLDASLKKPLLRRVSSATLGFRGAGTKVDLDPGEDSAIAKLQDVLVALEDYPGVLDLSDGGLQPNTWFVGRIEAMAYGWGRWDFCPEDPDVVFFTGTQDKVDILLAGSIDHMLDRKILKASARTGSTSERLREIVAKIVRVEDEGGRPSDLTPPKHDGAPSDVYKDTVRSSFECIDGFLERGGIRAPLTFVARAIEVLPATDSVNRLVVGSPLHVAHWHRDYDIEPTAPRHSQLEARRDEDSPARSRRRRQLFRRGQLASLASAEGDARTAKEDSLLQRNTEPDNAGRSESGAEVKSVVVEGPDPAEDVLADLEVELYIGPLAAARYQTTAEYCAAQSEEPPGAGRVAVTGIDFWSSSKSKWWRTERREWLVCFACGAEGMHVAFERPDDVRGDLVATSVGRTGTGEVIVLARDVVFADVERRLSGYETAEPELRWIVDRLPAPSPPREKA